MRLSWISKSGRGARDGKDGDVVVLAEGLSGMGDGFRGLSC